MAELPARERIILAIDTSIESDAERLASVAEEAGARFVKLGLELSSATSWRYCSELAAKHNLEWVADAKLDDIPNTVERTVRNIVALDHPPFGITMHATAGDEAMRVAQVEAKDIKMLGVTILTSIKPEEAVKVFGSTVNVEGVMTLHEMITNLDTKTEEDRQMQGQNLIDEYIQEKAKIELRQKVLQLAQNVANVGLQGVVSSAQEVGLIKNDPITKNLFAMIPGTRSAEADAQDQSRVGTPSGAIRDGADLLVIGRQITQAEDPAKAYADLVAEIEEAL